VVLSFIIRRDGTVQSARVSGDHHNPQLEDCARAVTRSLLFPSFYLPISVRYPIAFNPGG
jgi:outer membrane biosynthesis protein TonB